MIAPRTAVIELVGVDKVFPGAGNLRVLESVDLTVQPGELVAITGPSGSGKSTLLDIMGTLSRPTTGTVRIDGRLTNGMSDRELARVRSHSIGFVFQQFNLLPTLDARDNVAQALMYQSATSRDRRRRAEKALETVGLAHRLDHRPGELSGGERQRLAIARALVTEPSLILADEPTGSLDQRTGLDVMRLLRYVNQRGASVVVITHDEHQAGLLPRRVRMLDGRIVDDSAVNAAGPRPPSRIGAVG